MRIGRSVLLAASRNANLNEFALKSPVVRRATRKFMPGESVEDALAAGARTAATGRGIVFTQLGEAISNLSDALAVRDHYLDLFEKIQALKLPAHVSVKPTQLGLDQSHSECERLLLQLAQMAEQSGSVLWLDMEDSTHVDSTLELYSAIKAQHASAGIALQAYLFRTPADLERLLPMKPMVRLVKGAYDESPSIAYARKSDTDSAYFRIAVRMLESASSGVCTPIFGTHDAKLLQRIIARASSLRLGTEKYEIHMLYGIGESDQSMLVSEGHVVKTLISYGPAWFRWYMRRLAERPANVWFVAKSLLSPSA